MSTTCVHQPHTDKRCISHSSDILPWFQSAAEVCMRQKHQ